MNKCSQCFYLHSNFHRWQIYKRHLSCCHFPQNNGKTPHVSRTLIHFFRVFIQNWKKKDLSSKLKIKDWLINIKTKGAKTLVSVKPSTKTAESFLNDSINYYNSPRSYYQAYCNCKHFLLPSGAIHWGW